MDDLLSSIRMIMAEGERARRVEPRLAVAGEAVVRAAARPERAPPVEEALGRSLASAFDRADREAAEAEAPSRRAAALRLWGGSGAGDERKLAAPPGVIYAPAPAGEAEPAGAELHADEASARADAAPEREGDGQPAPHRLDTDDEAGDPPVPRRRLRQRLLHAADGSEGAPRPDPDAPRATEEQREARAAEATPRPGAAADIPARPGQPAPATAAAPAAAARVAAEAARARQAPPAEEVARARAAADAALTSERTRQGVGTAFGELSRTLLSSNPRTLEDLVREMLRPMLKEWLDANLTDIVERQVRHEIDRLARGH